MKGTTKGVQMPTNEGRTESVELAAAAKRRVARARDGEYLDAMEIIIQSAIALRGLLRQNNTPDPYRSVFLEALLVSLERIERGEKPASALDLEKPPHRVRDPNTEVRDVLVFVGVGKELDQLVSCGETSRKPVETAIQTVATRSGMSSESVQKIWTSYGSRRGWQQLKPDWK